MAKVSHSYSPSTTDALRLLGRQLTAERRIRKWKQTDLAERAGIATSTLIAIEKGAPTVAIGTVFEVARLLGVPVVGSSTDPLSRQLIDDRLSILPQRVARAEPEADDDF